MSKKVNTKNLTLKLCLTAMFIALVFVATKVLQIPFVGANGYFNLGDAVLLTGALFLGPVYGAVAAGVGAALADVISPFAIYAPATLVIKALMAVVFYFIAVKPMKKQSKILIRILFVVLGALVAEAVMVGGYFVFETCLYGVGTAALSVVGNVTQGACGLVIAAVLVNVLSANKRIREFSGLQISENA